MPIFLTPRPHANTYADQEIVRFDRIEAGATVDAFKIPLFAVYAVIRWVARTMDEPPLLLLDARGWLPSPPIDAGIPAGCTHMVVANPLDRAVEDVEVVFTVDVAERKAHRDSYLKLVPGSRQEPRP